MANPKRRHSKSRSRKRRANYKVRSMPVTHECSNCGNDKIMHRACPSCGHYRGREVIERGEFV